MSRADDPLHCCQFLNVSPPPRSQVRQGSLRGPRFPAEVRHQIDGTEKLLTRSFNPEQLGKLDVGVLGLVSFTRWFVARFVARNRGVLRPLSHGCRTICRNYGPL